MEDNHMHPGVNEPSLVRFLEGRTICILGRSGSGKGSQSKRFQKKLERLDLPTHYAYLGDIFRRMKKEDSERGREIRRCLDAGLFPPDRIAGEIIVESLEPSRKHTSTVVVYDGSPRKVNEAKMLDEQLERMSRKPALAIHLDVSRGECKRRLLGRGREDDTEEKIESRLDEFDKYTFSVLAHFESVGRLIEINGEQSVELVAQSVWSSITLLAPH